MSDERVLVTKNPFGYGIGESDIERILTPMTEADKIESEHVASFFKLPIDKLTKEILSRYAKASEEMRNVSIGSYHDDIRIKLIDSIASAKRCFSYGEYLACIELCALHGEMLANFLCIVHELELKSENTINKLTGNNKKEVKSSLKENNFYDELKQMDRTTWLVAGNIILDHEKRDLDDVHNLRVKYYHHWNQDHDNIEKDALHSLALTSKVASKHLEVLNNKDNLIKIKTYIKNHFGAQLK